MVCQRLELDHSVRKSLHNERIDSVGQILLDSYHDTYPIDAIFHSGGKSESDPSYHSSYYGIHYLYHDEDEHLLSTIQCSFHGDNYFTSNSG